MKTTRESVLDALRAAAGETVSGEWLSEQLSVSRVAVSKHIAALRVTGYEIESTVGSGYRLVAAPDLLLAGEVRAALHSDMWVRLEGGVPTGSTNDDAKALARSGAEHGTVVVAPVQTGGKGRLGRAWHSPSGGAYLSAIVRPQVAPLEGSTLPLVVAVGVARGLSELGVPVQLKWPNDVWLDGRKLAGILLETATEGEMITWVVAGVGINVLRTEQTDDDVACVSDVLVGASVVATAAAILDGIASAYTLWSRSGFAALAQEFVGLSMIEGDDVTVRSAAGEVIASGTVRGIDELGRLRLVAHDGTARMVATGDVTLREPASTD